MKIRIFLFMMMAHVASTWGSVSLGSLAVLPQTEVNNIIEAIDIVDFKVLKTSSEDVENFKVLVFAKLKIADDEFEVNEQIKAKIVNSEVDEKSAQIVLYTRNLLGPCDYNGFQKVSIKFKLNESMELLPSSLNAVINIYQRDLSCSNKYQSFVSDYL